MPNSIHLFNARAPEIRPYSPLFRSVALGFALLLGTISNALAITINVPADYATISAAVTAASPGDVILVAPGTYNENVAVNKSLTLRSSGGKGVTIINGAAGPLGTITITASNVTIGGFGQGFKINGYDSPSAGLEYAALYIQGVRSNITIRDNEIVADGEAGLLTESGQAVTNLVVNANTFSGKTFVGAQASDCGFANQFTVLNVPRQLIVISTGTGITFTSNNITGTAGSTSSVPACSTFGQGNTLVTIDASTVTIRGNTFAGTTTRFGASLRCRGTNVSIFCNTFNNAGLGAACLHITFNASLTALSGGANPNSIAGVASSNTFLSGGAYFAGATDIYRDAAQVSAIPQTPVACNTAIQANVTNTSTGEKFCSIQAAIDDANTVNGHTISVAAGMYNEDVNVSKDLTIQGAGMNVCTVSGPIGGAAAATFTVGSPGVTIDGFTITRDGNNTTDWNNPGLNIPGIAIQGQTNNAEIRNCTITGNRTGIDINNSNGNNIHNNLITFNRTGLIFRNQTDNTALIENTITDNWTLGVLFLEASGGTNSPVQSALNSTFNNNNISGNWYGQIQDRQSGGSLPAPGTTNMKNFECNWYGTTNPVKTNANSSEPGYAAQIPVAYGGSATPPGGQPDVLGTAADNLDYLLFLVSGTDNAPATPGFQPAPLSCTGGCPGGGVVINANSNGIFCSIQDAIDAATTGDRLKIATGTYTGNVDAATGGKNIIFAPGNSPGCVTIAGNLTLDGGDVLEMEINGTTLCTQHDQLIVSGTVTLGGATLTLPAGMYLALPGDAITLIDGSSPISGMFAQGNFATDGTNTYYINYAGGDGFDVVLTKCCGALLDLGIYNYIAPTPAGNKLQIKLRPNVDVIQGTYSAGAFAIRTLSTNAVTFTNLGSAFGYALDFQVSSGGYDYFFFSFASVYTGRNWPAGVDTLLLTLGYSCTGNATFELADDAVTAVNGYNYYQELGALDATGIFLPAATSATSPASVSIAATNNAPLCNSMPIDLNSTTSNGSPAFTYAWAGPDAYSNNVDDPAPFASTLAKAGTYTVTVTDGNGCTATGTTDVMVLANGGCVKNVDLATYYPTITQAIAAAETINGHTLEVPAGNWPENVNVTKALKIKGANVGIPCTGVRAAESIIMGTTAVTIASNGVTIDGFQIEGITGVSSSGYTRDTIRNNKVNALFMGITSTLVLTSVTDGYVIQDNCVDLADQTYDTQGFATNPILAATQTPGAWYVDRYAPNGFVSAIFGGSNRLKHSILNTDTQGNAFYNTQGRKYDIPGSTAMNIQLYVPAAWATTGRRMAGFWGTAVDGSNAVTDYPIIEFTSDGGVPRFRGWNSAGAGSWVDMGLPTGFAYDQWYTLNIALTGDNHYIYSVGDLSLTLAADPTTVSISNVILQGYNHTPGLTYDIYWDNFNAFDNPVAQNAPTVGVAVTAASGTQAVVLQDNSVSDAFYGHLLAAVATTPRTTVRGGTHTNLLQGVAAVNTLDGVTYAPSTVGVDNVSMTSFGGNYPALPAANFHAGVYVFTGGADPLAIVDILIDSVTVSNTGKTSPASAGLYFADFSSGAGARLNAVVTESFVTNNLNRGVQVRGANATAAVSTSSIEFNGADPYGTGGNDGFGIYAGVGATLTLNNNFITNPPAQAGIYPVTAMFIGVAPAANITAFENSINRNGNGSLTANSYPVAQFTATCNWWGSALIDVVDGLVDGNVTFVPYLNNGTDNSVARGFQPMPGSCVNPKRWYVNDLALTDDVFTLGLGDDLNQGTKRRPFRTIGKAITSVVSSDTVYVDAGMYNEQNVVPYTKDNLLFVGAGPSNPTTTMVDFTGTVTGKPTLFDIAGDATTFDGFQFKVDLTKLNSAIIATDPPIPAVPYAGGGLNGITIKNNIANPYQSTPGTNFGSYGNRNAFSINYGGPANYRVAAGGGIDNILVDNNIVTATVNGAILGDDAGDIAFRAAVAVDEGAGTYTRNTFQTINHDILVRFNSNGPVVIGGSLANANTFLGGGVTYADPNAAGGAVTIGYNTFNGLVTGSVLRLQNNYYASVVNVLNNTFSNLRWGISLENFPAATVSDNVFSPLAGYTAFRHITVNTKSLSSNSAAILQVPINGVFTGNTFNSLSPTVGGTAMAFYNHDSDNDNLGAFTVGTALSPNVFAKDFTWAVYLGDQTGSTYPAPGAFPEYNLGGASGTLMACWDKDIDIQKNTFDVGSGAQYPQFMNHTQRLALEAILWHLPDNICLGELIYFVPVELTAKVFLQGPYDSATGLMYDSLRVTPTLIPASEPYTAINTAFPGSFTKVNNFVTESGVAGSVFAVTGSNAIVDWVWLELRDKTNNTVVLATRSALVQRDGDIVDLDGTSAVLFPDAYADDYFVLVRHRNHLGAMTAAAINLAGAHFVDFTVAAQPTFGTTGTSARKLVKTAVYGLIAGNVIPKIGGGYQVIYNNANNDRAPILTVVGPSTPLNTVNNVYLLEDVNMDRKVRYNNAGNDRVIILNNVGASTPLAIITQQPNF